jgi:diguanylate cyclase (GGDEF)-like protein/PAS domain S-box-containing protein
MKFGEVHTAPPDARIALDGAGRVVEANAQAARLLQRSTASLVGEPVHAVFREPPDSVFATECAWALKERCAVAFEAYASHLALWIELRAQPVGVDGLTLHFRNVSGRKQSSDVLRLSEERLRHLIRAMADAVWDWDVAASTVWWSDGVHALLGGEAPNWLTSGLAWVEQVHPEDRDRVRKRVRAVLNGQGETWADEFRIQRLDEGYLQISGRAFLIRGADGAVQRVVGGITDVTLRLQADRELARLSRAQRMLRTCNETLIRAESESALLSGVCRIAVEIGGYAMAWVGYAREDADKSIDVVAHAGNDAHFMKGIPMSWDEAGPNGRGPAARTVQSGELVIVEDIALDPSFAPWLADSLASGFRGVACLPLRDKQRTFGFFYLYAPDVVRIGNDEVALLQELANNLAFGIGNLRAQQQQRSLHSAMLQMAVAVSAASGDAFFGQLARHMAQAVGARAAFIGRISKRSPGMVQSIAAMVEGQAVPAASLPVMGELGSALLAESSWFTTDLSTLPQALLHVLGAFRPTACAGVRLDDSAGRPLGMIIVLFDAEPAYVEVVNSTLQIFAARVASEIEHQGKDQRLRRQASLLDLAQDAIIVHGMSHEVRFWNKGAERLYGWQTEEVASGFPVTRLYNELQPFETALQVVREQGEWSGELVQTRRDGSTVIVGARWTLVRDAQDQPESVLAIHTDISARKRAEREIQQLAFYDPLTQLPNRVLLMERLQRALGVCQRTGRGGALLFIDLDNFKTLNDTLGHAMGDLLLQQVASRLKHCVRETDTVARLGGDEFVVLLQSLSAHADDVAMQARHIGEKILSALSAPFHLHGNEHVSTSSIGIAPFMGNSAGLGELLKHADIAMYEAKGAGRNTLRFFDPRLEAVVSARAALEADLRLALAQDELSLNYQPQVDAEGRIMGVEALVRWQHPQRGAIAPADFIPLADDTGMILQLGQWVLREACRQLARWATQPETAALTLSVNVSPRQFRHPEFVAQAAEVLQHTQANARLLSLELTENLLADDIDQLADKMAALRAHGLRFVLDDFGTGHSSLRALQQLPLQQLKIDPSFVRDLTADTSAEAIVRATIGLAANLKLQVMAAGVETTAQRDVLLSAGCRAFQGYLFSPPLTGDGVVAWVLSGATSTRQS